MLQQVRPRSGARRARATTAVDILSVATAVPEHEVSQEEVARRAHLLYPHYARLEGLYTNTGIDVRYACQPAEWYHQPRSWEERTQAFHVHALDLLEQVAAAAVEQAGLAPADIDMIVTNTVTGLAIPSLEARLMNRLAFRQDVERLPMFGLGCGAGVAGLARAARLARAEPDSTVLFLTVDLCTLCARPNDRSLTMFVAGALFGDGAAGAVVRSGGGDGGGSVAGRPRCVTSGEHLWRDSEHIMGWDITGDGFGVVLSPELPALMRERFRDALGGFLDREGLALDDFDGFLFHPGGRKILEGAQAVLGLGERDLAHSWRVLRKFGNMSSATALFVLEEALGAGARGRHLLTAFGPGFSAYFVVLDL